MKKNAIVGQSGGPTTVINSSLAGVFKTAVESGCKKVFGMLNGIEGLLQERYTDISEHIKSNLDIELLKRTPASFLGTCRYKLSSEENDTKTYEKIFGILEKLNIGYFFYIGGNDSMDTIAKLSRYGEKIDSDIRFMGIPKTIDNDIALTDHTPGYGSAAKYIATAVKEIICDAKTYSTDSVTIVEIMGRNAGWLTGASSLSRAEDCLGPDLIYLPEIPFDKEDFLNKVKEKKKQQKVVTIAVSEGLKNKEGIYVCEENRKNIVKDSFGHKLLGGTAMYLSDYITDCTGLKSRGIVFSTLQRCASHLVSRRDITEAYMAGETAVQEAINGQTGKMVAFRRLSSYPYNIVTELCDIEKVANAEKLVPQAWISSDGTNVTKEFEDYARPLIVGELSPFMVDGVPRHLFI